MRFVERKREGKWKWDGHWFAEGHVGRYVFFGANLAPLALTSIGLQHSSKPNYDVAGFVPSPRCIARTALCSAPLDGS